jgi:EmrB/QacA subfamily drug resistance transporter
VATTVPQAPSDATTIAGHKLDRSYLPLLLTLGLGVFAGALDLGVLSPALPALGADFHVGARDLPWIFTLYLLANVVAIPIMSKLSDTYGRRPIYTACLAIFAIGSVFAITASSYPLFLAARGIQAFGAGGIFPVATAAIADRVPPERRGAALGLVAATWGLAAIIGPLVGGAITNLVSWHWIFAANIPLALVVIVLAQRTVPTLRARVRGPLDIAGIAVLSVGLLALMMALTRAGIASANPLRIGGYGLLAAVLFAVLPAIERRAKQPVIAPTLFRTRQLAVTYVLEIAIGALEGALFFIPAALVAAQHLSNAAAGGIAAIGAVTFVAVIPLAGRALDRVGSRAVLALGSTCTAAGLLLFALGLDSLVLSILAMVVAGVGFGALLGAPTRYIITNEVGQANRASGVGLLSVFLIIGQIVGGSLAGGVAGSVTDATDGFRRAYLAFTVLAVVAVALTGLLKSKAAETLGEAA